MADDVATGTLDDLAGFPNLGSNQCDASGPLDLGVSVRDNYLLVSQPAGVVGAVSVTVPRIRGRHRGERRGVQQRHGDVRPPPRSYSIAMIDYLRPVG